MRGLNDHRKSRLVQSYLIRHAVDVCLLQETHLRETARSRLLSSRWSEVHTSSYSNYSRGVAILIKKGTPWQTLKVVSDQDGRYLILLGKLFHQQVLIANVYGLNVDVPSFFNQIWHYNLWEMLHCSRGVISILYYHS